MKSKTMYLRMTISSLIRRRSRMLITLLAVGIGSSILSGLLTIYYDIPRQMSKEFRSYGANLIFLPSAENESKKISAETVENINNKIPKEKKIGVAPYRYQHIVVNKTPYIAAGTLMKEAEANSPYWLINGEWPSKKGEVLIGNNISRETQLKAGDTIPISISSGDSYDNESVKIKTKHYQVSGVVLTGGAEESFIFLENKDLDQLEDSKNLFDVIESSVDGDEAYLKKLASEIEEENSEVKPRLAQRLTQSQDVVLRKLQALVWIVTIIVLILTMISVSTTMMAVVAERKKEIGLKKALGAPNKSIINEFVGESLLLGGLGGVIGVGLGYWFAQSVALSVFTRKIAFHWGMIPFTILTAIIITGLACILPIRKTVDIEPALVLRGE